MFPDPSRTQRLRRLRARVRALQSEIQRGDVVLRNDLLRTLELLLDVIDEFDEGES